MPAPLCVPLETGMEDAGWSVCPDLTKTLKTKLCKQRKAFSVCVSSIRLYMDTCVYVGKQSKNNLFDFKKSCHNLSENY